MTEQKSRYLLWIAVSIYAAIFIFLCLKKYYGFAYNGYDMSIFNQTFFNTLHGRWFENTINFNNYLGDHFSPILVLLLPIYALYPSAQTLLVMSTIALSLGAWPLYKITLHKTNLPWLSLMVALLWLVNPFVHIANLTEFHLIYFAPVLIFFTAYFFVKKQYWAFALFFFLALLVREDMPFILFGFFLISLFERRTAKWWLFSLVLSLTYFLFSINIIQHFSDFGGYKFFVYYNWLGGEDLASILLIWLQHPWQVIIQIFRPINILHYAALFLPVLFLPWKKPRYLLLTLLPALQFAVSRAGISSVVVANYYVVLLLPGVFVALAAAIDAQVLKNKFTQLCLGVGAIYFLIFLSPISHVWGADFGSSGINLKNQFAAKIQEDDKVLSESVFTPRLSTRREIYTDFYAYRGYSQFFHKKIQIPDLDYVLMDFESFITNQQILGIEEDMVLTDEWRGFMEKYQLTMASNNIYLFIKPDSSQTSLPLYKISPEPSLGLDQFEPVLQFIGGQRTLAVEVGNIVEPNDGYFVRFFRSDQTYITMPLDYGLWLPDQWPSEQVTVYFYPGDDIVSFQVLRGNAQLRLSRLQNIAIVYDIAPLTEQIYLDTLKIIESAP